MTPAPVVRRPPLGPRLLAPGDGALGGPTTADLHFLVELRAIASTAYVAGTARRQHRPSSLACDRGEGEAARRAEPPPPDSGADPEATRRPDRELGGGDRLSLPQVPGRARLPLLAGRARAVGDPRPIRRGGVPPFWPFVTDPSPTATFQNQLFAFAPSLLHPPALRPLRVDRWAPAMASIWPRSGLPLNPHHQSFPFAGSAGRSSRRK